MIEPLDRVASQKYVVRPLSGRSAWRRRLIAIQTEEVGPIVRDLIEIFSHPRITRECLAHLMENQDRFISGNYDLPDGRGCVMFLLTEPLGEEQIRSKSDLIAFFGREHGTKGMPGFVAAHESPEYQAAKWLVRLIDGQICERVIQRYGSACDLFDFRQVFAVARRVLVERTRANRLEVADFVGTAN